MLAFCIACKPGNERIENMTHVHCRGELALTSDLSREFIVILCRRKCDWHSWLSLAMQSTISSAASPLLLPFKSPSIHAFMHVLCYTLSLEFATSKFVPCRFQISIACLGCFQSCCPMGPTCDLSIHCVFMCMCSPAATCILQRAMHFLCAS